MGAISGNLSPDSRLADTDKNKSGAQISNSWCRCKCTCVQLLHIGSRSKKYYASLTRFQFVPKQVSPEKVMIFKMWYMSLLAVSKKIFNSRSKKHPGSGGNEQLFDLLTLEYVPMNVAHFRGHRIKFIHLSNPGSPIPHTKTKNRFLVWISFSRGLTKSFALGSSIFGLNRDSYLCLYPYDTCATAS